MGRINFSKFDSQTGVRRFAKLHAFGMTEIVSPTVQIPKEKHPIKPQSNAYRLKRPAKAFKHDSK